jgi:hypothetical protein
LEAGVLRKDKIAEALLGLVERDHPGFSRLAEYQELSTRLTAEQFAGHRGGSAYGYPGTPERYGKPWPAPATPVRNLFLTGADAGTLSSIGAMMGGVSTTALLLGPLGFLKIVAESIARVRRKMLVMSNVACALVRAVFALMRTRSLRNPTMPATNGETRRKPALEVPCEAPGSPPP